MGKLGIPVGLFLMTALVACSGSDGLGTTTNNPPPATGPDTSAPTAPAGLNGVPVSTSTITLSWGPSQDNVGVIGYRVYRNNLYLTTVVATSYPDTGLAAQTSYTYVVRAIDAAGNESSAPPAITLQTLASNPPAVVSHSLAQAAAEMQPGEWRELVTNNLEPTLNNPTCGATGSIFPYSEDAVWDPVSRRVFFIGSDHVYCDTMTQRFIAYSEATNSWTTLPNPPWFGNGVHHGYDHSAIDAANGIYYHFPYAGYGYRPLHRYDTSTDTWLSDTPASPNSTCCTGVEYFPEFVGADTSVAAGGVVLAGGRDVHVYRAATNSWVGPLNTAPLTDTGDYHNVAEYNPVHKVVIFGGGNGSGALYKLSANGAVTPLAAAPFPLRVIESIVTVDPVSGDYLVFGRNGEFYKFDVTDGATGTWTRLPGSPPFASPLFGNSGSAVDLVVAAPISTYGVVMFVKHIPGNAGQTKVYLYRHR